MPREIRRLEAKTDADKTGAKRKRRRVDPEGASADLAGDVATIEAVGRVAGNRAAGHLIQTKLAVGPAGDKYEREADAVADRVVRSLDAPVQRQEEEEEELMMSRVQRQPEEEEELLQAKRVQRQEEEEMILSRVQRQPEEEELMMSPVQRQEEEEELLQAKRVQRQEEEEEELMMSRVQRQPEEEELLQAKRVQRQEEEEELMMSRVQRQPEEEELMMSPVQRQEEEEELMMSRVQRQPEEEELMMAPVQRQEEEEELLQAKRVQRQEEEEELLQAKRIRRHDVDAVGPEGGELDASTEQAVQAARAGGHPLDERLRRSMEAAFGCGFSGVRVHTGSESDALNRSMSARAFTTGADIFVRRDDYDPSSTAGKHLLAHELTHVVQQGAATDLTAPDLQRLAVQRLMTVDLRKEKGLRFSKKARTKINNIRKDLDHVGQNVTPNIDFVLMVDSGKGTCPAETVAADDAITVHMRKWYINMATEGEILGMLLHELGVHTLADREMSEADPDYQEEEQRQLVSHKADPKDLIESALAITPLATRTKPEGGLEQHPDETRQWDHIAAAQSILYGTGGRAKSYTRTMLRMGDAIEASDRKPKAKTAAQKDLVKVFFIDVGRLVAADADDDPIRTFNAGGLIAEVFTWYRAEVVKEHAKAHPWLNKKQLKFGMTGGAVKWWLFKKLLGFFKAMLFG